MILRVTALLSLLIITSYACREATDEPALEERSWGGAEDIVGPKASRADSGRVSADSVRRDAPPTSGRDAPPTSGRDAPPTTEAQLPLSRDGLMLLLRPETPPGADEARLLRVGLDALGEAPESPQRSRLMKRLLVAWARRDAADAVALALALPEAPREDALVALAATIAPLVGADGMPALLALAALPAPAQRRLLGRCARGLAAEHPAAARACHAALGERGDRIAVAIARDVADRDEAAARLWVAAIHDLDLRTEALAEIAAASADPALDGIDDAALREGARARALLRLAEERPQAALVGLDAVGDAGWRAEILEAAAWTWVRQGFPELAQEALEGTAVTTAQIPLRRLAETPKGAAEVPKTARTLAPSGDCEGLTDPHLSGACRAQRVEAAVAQGDRDGARAALQAIPDDAWRAAALLPLYRGLDAQAARAWLRRSQALRERLPDPVREAHLRALLERCELPPLAHLRDGLALLQGPALRQGLLLDASAALPAGEASEALALLGDPLERALLSVAFLEAADQ